MDGIKARAIDDHCAAIGCGCLRLDYSGTGQSSGDFADGTLDIWLDLNADYDAALRTLYQAILDSGGSVTPAVRAAYDAEASARERLPSDTKGLVIILGEIGRGGLNQAVIAIEEARSELDAALLLGVQPDEAPAAP